MDQCCSTGPSHCSQVPLEPSRLRRFSGVFDQGIGRYGINKRRAWSEAQMMQRGTQRNKTTASLWGPGSPTFVVARCYQIN
jgi:hypothetical protein